MIATPAYGGMFHSNYVLSLLATTQGLMQEKIEFTLYTIGNDALISRARNWCAVAALEGGYDKLMFIDSDIGWKWEDLKRLLSSEKKLVGGTYPVKSLPLTLNYNVLPAQKHILDNGRVSIASHQKLKELADPVTGEIAVYHIPTGFMLIDRSVLLTLQPLVSYYQQAMPNNPIRDMWDFFPVRVHSGRLESEDWSFCTLCREAGIEVTLNTNIITTHVGSHMFRA